MLMLTLSCQPLQHHHVHHIANMLQVQLPAPGHVTTKPRPLLPPVCILSMPPTPCHHPRVPDTLTQRLAEITHVNLVALDLSLTVTIAHCGTTNLTVVGQPGDVWGSEVR